jgi:orotate phosphoribosyltransferase
MEKQDMSALKKELLEELKNHAFFKEKIVLSSGKESSYYVDCRLVTLSAKGAFLSGSIILEMVKEDRISAIGGPTLGADPIVGAVASLSYQDKKPINTFIVRSAPKSHGKMRQIEGPPIAKGSKVVLIDDVATTGKSIVQAIEVLRSEGIIVDKAIVIVDREEGAAENLAKQNCSLIPIFKASDFLG